VLNKGLPCLEHAHFRFAVEGKGLAVFFVDDRIIAFLTFSLFNGLLDPLAEFKPLRVAS
jgi:hypothetical protein